MNIQITFLHLVLGINTDRRTIMWGSLPNSLSTYTFSGNLKGKHAYDAENTQLAIDNYVRISRIEQTIELDKEVLFSIKRF